MQSPMSLPTWVHLASGRWSASLESRAAFIILSFYSVIGGWAIAYAVDTAIRGLAGLDARAAQLRFDALMAAPLTMAAYHLVYMAAVALIVARGIARGIEEACKVLMPILIALIIGLSLFSIVQGDVGATLRFLFRSILRI